MLVGPPNMSSPGVSSWDNLRRVSLAAGGAGLFTSPLAAEALTEQHKRVLLFYMAGGLSQLESWEPKPATRPVVHSRDSHLGSRSACFRTAAGNGARIMDRLLLVRGVNTSEDDHGKGQYLMLTGRRQSPAEDHPRLGAVVAKALDSEHLELPGHIHITPGGGGGRSADAAYLGPQYASVVLGNGNPPAHTALAGGVTEQTDAKRHALRRRLSDHFLARRRTAQTDAYMQSYDQALRLMQRRDTFDVSKEPENDQERYGKYDLGRHCLLAPPAVGTRCPVRSSQPQ